MIKVSGKLEDVQVGDVVGKGPVSRVGQARRSRAGRMLMIIEIDHGTHKEPWVVAPDTEAVWLRPE